MLICNAIVEISGLKPNRSASRSSSCSCKLDVLRRYLTRISGRQPVCCFFVGFGDHLTFFCCITTSSSLEPPSAPTQIPSSMLAFAPTQFAEPMASIVHDQPDLPLAPPPIPTASFNPCTNAVYNPGPSTGVSAEAAPVLNYPQKYAALF